MSCSYPRRVKHGERWMKIRVTNMAMVYRPPPFTPIICFRDGARAARFVLRLSWREAMIKRATTIARDITTKGLVGVLGADKGCNRVFKFASPDDGSQWWFATLSISLSFALLENSFAHSVIQYAEIPHAIHPDDSPSFFL